MTPEGVYRVLRVAILDGSVPPCGQLRKTHIAADLGISRSPLREALTRLEEEGMVVKIPFRGAFVAQVSAANQNKSYLLREGDQLYDGDVVSINRNEVVFKQIVQDPTALKPFREVVKSLNPSS